MLCLIKYPLFFFFFFCDKENQPVRIAGTAVLRRVSFMWMTKEAGWESISSGKPALPEPERIRSRRQNISLFPYIGCVQTLQWFFPNLDVLSILHTSYYYQFSETKNAFKDLENQHNFANEVTKLDQCNFVFRYKTCKVRPVGEMKSILFFFSFSMMHLNVILLQNPSSVHYYNFIFCDFIMQICNPHEGSYNSVYDYCILFSIKGNKHEYYRGFSH